MLALYQSSDASIYALSKDPSVPPPLPGIHWEYRCTCTLEDLGPYYVEAARLVRDRGYCMFQLTCTQLTDVGEAKQVAA